MNMRLILLSLFCCASAAYADVWGDISQAAQVAYTANLNGEYVRQTQTGVDSFDIYRLRDSQTLTERRVAKNGKAYEILRMRDKISFYAATAQDLKAADIDESNRFPAVLPFSVQYLSESYQASYQGEGRIAGRACHIVRLTPYDDNRYTQELCLDDADNLPLSRIYLHNDTIVRADLFAALDRETQPVAAELTPTRGLNYSMERTLNEDFARLGENDTFIQSLPAGFRVAGFEQGTLGGYYLITDGLANITLFVEPADNAPHQLPNIAKNGVRSIASRHSKKHHLTAIGDLPQDGLKRWLESIEFAD